jgi:predicted Rossmann fold flavoprotein
LIKRRSNLGYRALEEFLTGMLNKRLGQVIVKSIGLKLNEKAENLTDKNLEEIAKLIKDFRFKVIGTTGYTNSQVTAGGLDTTQFNEKTMEAKSNKGLYAIGEILDIDGDCGGFNLMWAWASAICAAESILRGYKK